ncbi:hypothetical protein BDD12DRAFT_809898 [Trichophaea hybrida]|nr:hypothetical protein BDD12DRAFT_809898 [Trichophaea hybrida]
MAVTMKRTHPSPPTTPKLKRISLTEYKARHTDMAPLSAPTVNDASVEASNSQEAVDNEDKEENESVLRRQVQARNDEIDDKFSKKAAEIEGLKARVVLLEDDLQNSPPLKEELQNKKQAYAQLEEKYHSGINAHAENVQNHNIAIEEAHEKVKEA